MSYGTCEKCDAELIPGQNWYTNKLDRICCDCSGHPKYLVKPIRGHISYYGSIGQISENEPDYEEAILDRDKDWLGL